MFLLPIIPTYIMAYMPQWLPDHSAQRLYVNLAADFLFLTSLFVLGGDFWDKLRALFVYDARAQFEPHPPKKPETPEIGRRLSSGPTPKARQTETRSLKSLSWRQNDR